jgi:zinc finger FYVE domain-containing protein 1
VFLTSSKQQSCTIGVHCAYDVNTKTVLFDTEGLLSVSINEDKRASLLLKVLSISDVIIYKTRAERLHNDLFKFLSDASTSYLKYFSNELRLCSEKLNSNDISALGPSIIIFHETHHTEPLKDERKKTIQMQINEMFSNLKLPVDAFKSIDYVGVKTTNQEEKDNFLILKDKIVNLLDNNSIRSPRKVTVIYHLVKSLNDKFNGNILIKNIVSKFPDEYFTCNECCLACG